MQRLSPQKSEPTAGLMMSQLLHFSNSMGLQSYDNPRLQKTADIKRPNSKRLGQFGEPNSTLTSAFFSAPGSIPNGNPFKLSHHGNSKGSKFQCRPSHVRLDWGTLHGFQCVETIFFRSSCVPGEPKKPMTTWPHLLAKGAQYLFGVFLKRELPVKTSPNEASPLH